MVSVNALKWATAILAISAACCCVGVGLPMWIEINYGDSTPNIYLRMGLWQICLSFDSGSITCTEYTATWSNPTLTSRYLGAAGAGCLLLGDVLLILYTCQCAKTTCLSISALLLTIGGVGVGSAAVGLFLTNNLVGSMKIAIGGILELVGLGVGLIAFIVILAALLKKDEDKKVTPEPPDYVRNERRFGPRNQLAMPDAALNQDPGTSMPARDEARYYLDRYRSYQDQYNESLNNQAWSETPLPGGESDQARFERYERYFREMQR